MEKFKEYKTLVDQAIEQLNLPEKPHRLYDPVAYILALGGKRLRPVLTLMACEMFGGRAEDALDAAIGLEIFHNFTLLHDDIMDQAELRRGKKTVHKKWNTNVAILSGDTMFALAYQFIAASNTDNLKEILTTFTQTAIEVCEGQQYDMDFETADKVSIPEYLLMIRMKTAVLLGASLKTGALIARAPAQQAQLLYDFGINAGMAFQLKDDLLDAFGVEDKFGKTIGGDIIANKKTFLYLKCLEMANQEDYTMLRHLYSPKIVLSPGEKIAKVLEIYNRYHIREITTEEMEKFFSAALQIMQKVNTDPAMKNRLESFAEWLYKRDH